MNSVLGHLRFLVARLEEIFLHRETDDRRLRCRCAVAAVILLISAYPGVIFRGASLSIVSFLNVTIEPRPVTVQVLPERAGREAYHGHGDAGGSAYQSEPSAQFVERSIWSGQSLYWNPYSATGMYGIETLVDVKTSPLTVLTALLGGGDLAFHIVLLSLHLLGLYCLLMLMAVKFRLCFLAAVASGVTYVLNGFHVPHPAANFSQIWLYFPVLTLALVSFAKAPATSSFLGITAASLLMLSTVFLPTTLIVLGCAVFTGVVAATAFSTYWSGWKQICKASAALIAGQAAAVLLALLILAIIYLPIAEAMRYMGTADFYGLRVFHSNNLFNFISLFTPKHAFEAYNAITPRAERLRGHIAYHQGIVGILLVLQTIRFWPPVHRIIVASLGVLLVVMIGRAYAAPGLTFIVDHIPIVGNFGQQYIWAGIGVLVTFLVPFGVHGLVASGVRILPLAGGAIVILGALAYTTGILGIESRYALFYIVVAVLFVVATVVLAFSLRYSKQVTIHVLLLVLLSWSELTFYVNHHQVSRTDRFSEIPRFVRFLQTHAGLDRVASYGYYGIPPEYGAAYGIYQIGSMNFQIFPRYLDLFNRLVQPDKKDRWVTFATFARAGDTDRINLAAFDMLGVKYVVMPFSYVRLQAFMDRSGWPRAFQDRYFTIFQNPESPPRAMIVSRLLATAKTPVDIGRSPREVATTDDTLLLDQARVVGLTDQSVAPKLSPGSAAITRYANARVEVVANLTRPGIFVLNDAWHANWTATVDGQRQHLGVVNGAFRGMVLPAGNHLIEMTYAPRTLGVAKILSLLGMVIALALWSARRMLDRCLTHLRPALRNKLGH